jgi:hypothetical protein
MGRPPIFKKAMSKTRIQRRWRAKVKRAKRKLTRGEAELRPLTREAEPTKGGEHETNRR